MSWESVFIVALLFLTPGPTRSSFPDSSDPQDDLAAHVSMFHLLQGLDGLLEWIDVVDDHLELSGIDEARNAPQQFSFRRSTVPQRAQKAAPIDSDTLGRAGISATRPD